LVKSPVYVIIDLTISNNMVRFHGMLEHTAHIIYKAFDLHILGL